MDEQKDEKIVYENGKPSLTASIAKLLCKSINVDREQTRKKFKK